MSRLKLSGSESLCEACGSPTNGMDMAFVGAEYRGRRDIEEAR